MAFGHVAEQRSWISDELIGVPTRFVDILDRYEHVLEVYQTRCFSVRFRPIKLLSAVSHTKTTTEASAFASPAYSSKDAEELVRRPTLPELAILAGRICPPAPTGCLRGPLLQTKLFVVREILDSAIRSYRWLGGGKRHSGNRALASSLLSVSPYKSQRYASRASPQVTA